ncbi:PRKR-interacting protein 1 [Dipsacomyces acuminosporus]|nr:PRKR-interacting protein 1 [Dipsacomyces acuminosporus]
MADSSNGSSNRSGNEAKAAENGSTSRAAHRLKRSAADDQRSHIENLMRNVDKAVELPASKKPMLKPPPDLVLNVRGSSAGAGSSDFHTYREIRRKENLRVKLMEEEAAEDKAKDEFGKEMESLKKKDEAKTAKNRAKRNKRKHKGNQDKKGASAASTGTGTTTTTATGTS